MSEPNAIPEELREAPMLDVLSWAGCWIEYDEHGHVVAIDGETGSPISTALPMSDRRDEIWEWLRAAHGRFAAFEQAVRDRVEVRVEVRSHETAHKVGVLLGALGYRAEVSCVG